MKRSTASPRRKTRAMLEWGHGVLCKERSVRYAFIDHHKYEFSITSMCKILDIKPSSYYDWTKRDISAQQIHRNRCELLIKAAHGETKERYGYQRLHAHLSEQGHDVSKYMVRSIKEEHDIKCRRHKRFKVIPILKNNTQVAPLPLSDRPN